MSANQTTSEELDAKRRELFEKKIGAEGELQHAQNVYGEVKERHDQLTTQMFEAVTREDRYRFKSQVDENAEKLKNAIQQVDIGKADLSASTDALQKFDEERSKDADRMGIAAWSMVSDLHKLAEGMVPPEVIEAKHQAVQWAKDVWPTVQALGVQGTIELAVNSEVAKYAAKPSDQHPEWQKIETENNVHQQQVNEVQQIKGEVVKELESKGNQMGTAPTFNELKDFHATSTQGFEELDKKFTEHDTQTNALHQSNLVEDPELRTAQMQNRAVMEQAMHVCRYEATREVAEAVAKKEVELANHEQLGDNQTRLESQAASKQEIEASNGKLMDLQQEQRKSDEYEQTNKIHAQHCPELASNPPAPALAASGPGGGGAPQQQGPELQI